ncbi:hypothetical protein LCGC14_2703390, partial [marine sediment metagenome]
MSDDTLEAWGQRWNTKAKADVAFSPEDALLNPTSIEMGIPALDLMLGGGIPRGRTSMFFGEPSTGKTLLAQRVIAAAQKQGGRAMFDGLETVRPEVMVVDSIPALVPQAMLEAEMEKQDFRGLAARKITEGVAKATQYNQTTALIFINQLRTDLGKTFGNPEKLPGGKALKFHVSLIVRVRRGQWLTEADVAEDEMPDLDTVLESDKEPKRIGFMLRLRTEKNKLAPPEQSTSIKFYFNGRVDPMGSLVHLAIQRGVIEGTRGYYEVPGVDGKVHGFSAV